MAHRKNTERNPGASSGYKKRKVLFFSVLLAIFILLLLMLLLRGCHGPGFSRSYMRAGVCGEVYHPAVYTIPEGADLATLVYRAGGLTDWADIRNIDLNIQVLHDSIYHIPSRPAVPDTDRQPGYEGMTRTISEYFTAKGDAMATEPAVEAKYKDLEQINILFVGLPAVYIIINFMPDFNRINIIHIPHSAVFLANNYRIMDIFLTLGVDPTRKILQRQTGIRLDYYIIQNKPSFIEMINRLGGITLNLDEPFANAYDLEPGKQKMDGFYTWEYIRFLDFKRIRREWIAYEQQDMIREDVFKVKPDHWTTPFVVRNQRQRHVVNAMRTSFNKLSTVNQILTLRAITKTLDTDLDVNIIQSTYKDFINISDYAYGRLPGEYRSEGESLYFFPHIPSFKSMRGDMIRQMIRQKEPDQAAY